MNNGCKNISDKLKISRLLCEYAVEPLSVNQNSPRFSWIVNSSLVNNCQSAYLILVSSDRQKLEKNNADMWDSGKIISSKTINISYKGKVLKSAKDYYWKVKIWDKKGYVSHFSSIAKFEMALLDPKDWKGKWLTFSSVLVNNGPIFRKELKVRKNIHRARVYISGLGYYELTINGKKVGDQVLDPGWTDYSKRVLYATYDVNEFLNTGVNIIGVMLGNGWFISPHYRMGFGRPQFILQMNIEYKDGVKESLCSDISSGWIVSNGPIISNSIYSGEVYDARLEKPGWNTPDYNISSGRRSWSYPLTVDKPGGRMIPQTVEPIKVLKEIKPVIVAQPKKSVYVFDLGQNISGWVRLRVKGPKGSRVTIKHAEIIYENGLVNQQNLRSADSTDVYILKGEGIEEYEPRFTYHGFRYVQVEGFPGKPDLDSIAGKLVASSIRRVGSFTCGNELLNKIYNNIIWTLTDNRHSVPTDCPQRDERLGWLNDATSRAEGEIYNFNMSRFYPKWLDDISDTQGEDEGTITDTAPYVLGGRPADPVCSCYVIIPWLLYLHYGDREILLNKYEGMKKWVEYLGKQAIEYIISYGPIGDWSPPIIEGIKDSIGNGAVSANTPGKLISTGYYYYMTMVLSKVADIIGRTKDSQYFLNTSLKVKKAFNREFFDPYTANYASGNQACNIFPLYLGIVPEKLKEKVICNILKDLKEHDQHLTTGNQCTKYLIETLTDLGHVNTAYAVMTKKTYPSFGYMIERGATTIWERWEYLTGPGMNSHNHPMQGSISPWFYRGLAGIDIAWNHSENGNTDFSIKPQIVKELKYVKASIETIKGKVGSYWNINENGYTHEVIVPFNCRAEVFIPKEVIKTNKHCLKLNGSIMPINGKSSRLPDGIIDFKQTHDYFILKLGSGNFRFELMGL